MVYKAYDRQVIPFIFIGTLFSILIIYNNSGVTAYKELVKIIKHGKFRCNEVPNNLASLKQFRDGLPLIPIKSHSVLNKPRLPLNPLKMHIIFQS